MHTEKEALTAEMNQLQIQNQHLLDELESLSRGQFADFQKRHAKQQPYANQIRSQLRVVGPNQQNIVYPYQQAPMADRGGGNQMVYPHPQQDAKRQEVMDSREHCQIEHKKLIF